MGHHRAGAPQLAQARRLRIRPRRAVRDPRRCPFRPSSGQGDGSRHHGRGALARGRPGVRHGTRTHPRLLDLGGVAAGHRAVGAWFRTAHTGEASDAACDRSHPRPLRIRRAHHPRRRRGGPRCRLHADCVPQGASAQDGHPAARTPKRDPPHDRRHRDTGWVPPRRARRDRAPLQLPRYRADHARSCTAEGLHRASAGVLVIGFTFVVVTLVADIISALLNPRIRFEASE